VKRVGQIARRGVPNRNVHSRSNFVQWGVGRNFDKVLDIGVSGYCSWQTTLDEGSDVSYANFRDHVFAVGPEVQYFSPEYNLGYHFRFWQEFGAVDRPEGVIVTLTVVKPF
jgi:hypothetical protein